MKIAWDSMVRGIIPAIVALVFALARKVIPTRRRVSSLAAIESAGISVYVNTLVAVAVGLIGLITFLLFKYLNECYAWLGPRPERILFPDWFHWMTFPFLAGLCCGWDAVLYLWRTFINRAQADAFAAWTYQKAGFDSGRVLRWMFLLLGVPALLAQMALIPMHDSFFADRIAIGRMGHLAPEVHPYSTVTAFKTVEGIRLRDGSFENEPTIVLEFSDGKRWTSWSIREDRTMNHDLVGYLSEKLHRQPVEKYTER